MEDLPIMMEDLPIINTPVANDYYISFDEPLGQGSYGEVFKCYELKDGLRTGNVFAAKIVDMNIKTKTEAALQIKCAHENVVRIFALYNNKLETPRDTRRGKGPRDCLVFIMEFMGGGELFKRIVKKKRFTEKDASLIMRKIAEAVAYMHSMDIAHRDLKPENFLLISEDCPDYFVKIADFGFAKLGPGSTPLGSGFYTSPSKVQGIVNRTRVGLPVVSASAFKNDAHCDMWTLGVILYVMLVGYPPFRPTNKQGNIHSDRPLQQQILQGNYSFSSSRWASVSDCAKDLVRRLMDMDSSRRMTAAELLQDPWVTGAAQDLVLNSPGAIGAGMADNAVAIHAEIKAMRDGHAVKIHSMDKIKGKQKHSAEKSATASAAMTAAAAAATATTNTTTDNSVNNETANNNNINNENSNENTAAAATTITTAVTVVNTVDNVNNDNNNDSAESV